MVFSLMGLVVVLTEGNTYRPEPVSGCNSRTIATACEASGPKRTNVVKEHKPED
jgi:hypothetical protein